jgi:Fungal chitosanase of glycosyl hydrolase group 75
MPPQDYTPDAASLPLLGHIPEKLKTATDIAGHFERPPRVLATLPTGEIYMDSELQLDTDGWPDPAQGDGTHLEGTSWGYSGPGSGDHPINANEVPYFVLPKGGFDSQHHVGLGDYAAVLFKDKLVFAVFADRGEEFRIGEGSIHLLRKLGFERIRPNGHVINQGTPAGVITIVFPRSGPGASHRFPNQAALLAALNANARPFFERLRDTPMTPVVG